jgi:TetR/AcrR family transcriptional regulator
MTRPAQKSVDARRRIPSADRRREIVETLLELISEGAPDGVSTPAIARRLGVTQAAIFKHFSTKQAIWAAVMDRIGELIVPALAAAQSEQGSRHERICKIARAYVGVVEKTPAMLAILFHPEVLLHDPETRQALVERFLRLETVFRDAALAAIEAGEYREAINPEQISSLLVTILQGALLRWTLADRSFNLEQAVDQAIASAARGFVRSAAPD